MTGAPRSIRENTRSAALPSVASLATTRPPRVLIIHYFFPPLGGVGAQRVVKFVKYLSALGWEVAVLTTNTTWYGVQDRSLFEDIPSTVMVTRAGEVPIQLRHRAAKLLDRAGARSLMEYFGWPDDASGWIPAATLAAVRLVRGFQPDVIFSSSAPYSGHLVALLTKALTGVPWVADFRDEWSQNPFARESRRLPRRLTVAAERAVLAHASRTVVVGGWYRFSGASHQPLTEIPNGIDDEDLPPRRRTPHETTRRFCLTYVGSLYGQQDCRPVFSALRRLATAGLIDPEAFEVRIAGNMWIPDAAVDLPVRVSRLGYLAHREAVAEMHRATALLLYVAPSSLAVPAKLYEYLVAERPILCVTREDNRAYELVRDLGAGVTAPVSDPARIESAILALYERWRADELFVDPRVREETIDRFSRRRLTRMLSDVLIEAAEPRLGVPRSAGAAPPPPSHDVNETRRLRGARSETRT